MIKIIISSLALMMFFTTCKTSSSSKGFQSSLFIAYDYTAEKLFSNNIEGPAVDKEGNLFVVNYQKDGTIGFVKKDGTVELFLTLPEGSTGNSIQFNKDNNMLVADFTGHNILLVNRETKAVSTFCHNDFTQPNDICLSKKGWIYASDPNWKESTGRICGGGTRQDCPGRQYQ